jgi:AraC-like DNA-binding protein
VIGYLLTAIILVHLYKRDMKNHQSAVLPGQLSWLSIVLYGFLIMNYLGFLKHYVYDYFGVYSHLLFMSQILSYLIFPLIMFYYGLKHPELFSLIEFKVIKPQTPSLSEKVLNDYKMTLIRYMEEQKLYLISDITINKLSELVEIPVRSLSEVINKGFNQNFFEFINTYRIQEAKKLMAGSHRNKTILEVIYEVGYNNKSVFNSVFKKYTGKTPKEYRSEILN